jgi:hypothetical protein
VINIPKIPNICGLYILNTKDTKKTKKFRLFCSFRGQNKSQRLCVSAFSISIFWNKFSGHRRQFLFRKQQLAANLFRVIDHSPLYPLSLDFSLLPPKNTNVYDNNNNFSHPHTHENAKEKWATSGTKTLKKQKNQTIL